MKTIIDVLKDIWGYLKETKKIYLSILMAFLLILGALIILTEGSAIMPFIYTLF